MVLMGVDPFCLQRLDQARSRAFILDDDVSAGPFDFSLSPKRQGYSHQLGILEPAADNVDQVDLMATVPHLPDGSDGIVREFRRLHGSVISSYGMRFSYKAMSALWQKDARGWK